MQSQETFFEELSLNAWPSIQTVHYAGWILRFASGTTRRSNSIRPAANEDEASILERIAYCEKLYPSKKLPVTFQLNSFQPSHALLDQLLEQRGYLKEGYSCMQVAEFEPLVMELLPSPEPGIQIFSSETLSAEWLAAYCNLHHLSEPDSRATGQILGNIILPHCFVSLADGDEILGTVLAVQERGYTGIFGVLVHPRLRNNGMARKMLQHALRWSEKAGGKGAYLLVQADNTVALRLYQGLGFNTLYNYWYRVKN
jgi:ribosomal protein S18 acetylase RimI-like enzyme